MTRTLAATLLISLSLAGATAPGAIAADYIGSSQAQSYNAGVCSESSVLGFITSRFEYRDANYLHANLSIAEIRDMGQNRQEFRDASRRA